jgi:hypothetical protein
MAKKNVRIFSKNIIWKYGVWCARYVSIKTKQESAARIRIVERILEQKTIPLIEKKLFFFSSYFL